MLITEINTQKKKVWKDEFLWADQAKKCNAVNIPG